MLAERDPYANNRATDSPIHRRVGWFRALTNFGWQATRWNSLRGRWFLDHLRHHQPFDPQLLHSHTHIDVMVAIVDHFEPGGQHGDDAAGARVAAWGKAYRRIAERHRDADGRPPQHTWFYRLEYLNPACVQALSEEAYRGFGEVEFHLHHGHDTHETFAAKLEAGLALSNQFGAMLTAEARPRRRFAYIAGNWSLDNGTGDPSKSGCNTELIALRGAGCFADFTFPAMGTWAQPRKTNAIYYATDDPRPKSYDTGVDVEVGRSPCGDLMIVQGPLLFDWAAGNFESSAIEEYAPPSVHRLEPWLQANVHVRGRPEWVFVKLHTHGMQSEDVFLSEQLDELFEAMDLKWNRPPFRLHFVTAREMYNIIKAAEAGHAGDPNPLRDFEVPLPANRVIRCNRPWHLLTYSPVEVEVDILEPGPAHIEFRSGPVRSVRGKVHKFKARFADQCLVDLIIEGEGVVIDPSPQCPVILTDVSPSVHDDR
jgi:hypothetical protein